MKMNKNYKSMNSPKARMLAGVGVALTGVAMVISGTASAATTAATTTVPTATQQQRLQNMITKGDQEIARRLTTLDTLNSKIQAATKLTSGDKATLSSEVTSTISGLTTLKTQLDSETTLANARTDVQNIYDEYRVYALVAPKISLIKVADDQQVTESRLTTLAQKLQTRIAAKQKAGKDVSTLQTELNDMIAKTTAAQSISANIESVVVNLQPADYNSNHTVLSGDSAQLKTAHADNQAAVADAKNIISSLKTL